MRHNLRAAAIWISILILVLPTLGARDTQSEPPFMPNITVLFGTPARISKQAVLAATPPQDAIRQIQMVDPATTRVEDVVNQSHTDELAAGAQTTVTNNMATQTQVATLEPTQTPTFREMLK